MTEKQQKTAFVRQLKPALNAVKKFSKPKYADGFRVGLVQLHGRINVKWLLAESKAVKPLAVGSYEISVPVPACVKLAGRVQATGAADVQKTLEALVEAVK